MGTGDIGAAVAALMIGLIVLVPIAGLTLSLMLKAVLDPLRRTIEEANVGGFGQSAPELHERVSRIEERLVQIEEGLEFQRRLETPSVGGS